MSENEPTRPNGPAAPAAPPTLEYSRSTHAMAPAWQWVLGILLSFLSIIGSASVFGIAAGVGGFIVAPLVSAIIFVLVGWHLRRGVAYRPMAAGIWTGVALAVLLDGLCWVALSGARIGG